MEWFTSHTQMGSGRKGSRWAFSPPTTGFPATTTDFLRRARAAQGPYACSPPACTLPPCWVHLGFTPAYLKGAPCTWEAHCTLYPHHCRAFPRATSPPRSLPPCTTPPPHHHLSTCLLSTHSFTAWDLHTPHTSLHLTHLTALLTTPPPLHSFLFPIPLPLTFFPLSAPSLTTSLGSSLSHVHITTPP